ncbi:hypothetical protein CPB83DRAFT_841163 [Crepidotus variabilis]|uniref:Uncharacterized protein n=1 Tax=Crepidotus variabilis TaxID=179855 RepID=A0A9P6E300_9AGAR|nr:hypothetical protein CPB83DRAFT_841163 [Crepidotus variabilis]
MKLTLISSLFILFLLPTATNAYCCYGGYPPNPCDKKRNVPSQSRIYPQDKSASREVANVLKERAFVCCCWAGNHNNCGEYCLLKYLSDLSESASTSAALKRASALMITSNSENGYMDLRSEVQHKPRKNTFMSQDLSRIFSTHITSLKELSIGKLSDEKGAQRAVKVFYLAPIVTSRSFSVVISVGGLGIAGLSKPF